MRGLGPDDPNVPGESPQWRDRLAGGRGEAYVRWVLAGLLGVGFAAASRDRRAPLRALLLVAELPAIVFACLALTGLDQLHPARGTGATVLFNPVFPYSRNLLGSCALALVGHGRRVPRRACARRRHSWRWWSSRTGYSRF